MKLRNGFVSNSSSSSFIIAINGTKCITCGHSESSFLNLFKEVDGCCDDTCVDAVGSEEVLGHVVDWGNTDLLEKLKKHIKKNPKDELALVSISYHDSTLENILNTSKNIKVLYSDNE